MKTLKLASVNARGLGSSQKRRDVVHYLRNLHFDIVFLQDTHLTEEKVPFFDSLWKGYKYHACFSNNSRGTTILIDRSLQHTKLFEFTCKRGNYVIIGCRIGMDNYVLGCIYGPNKDEPEFYEEVNEVLRSVDCDHIILGGDLNFVMNSQIDCYGYVRENNVNARNKFISMCTEHNLIDVWRQFHPHESQYTWIKANPSKGARLDMFFISDHLSNLCIEQKILPGYRTDHNMITLEIKINDAARGPGLWKFNESLLNDEKYIDLVDNCIETTVEQYALPIYSPGYLTDVDNYNVIAFKINDDLFYETLLMLIRGETVRFAKQKAKDCKKKEKDLVAQVEKNQSEHFKEKSDESARRLEQCKEELENFRKPMINGLIVRSRTQWHEEGERSSKYFLNLEKRNALKKSVGIIKTEDQILTRTNSILEAFTEHIASKYSKQHTMPQAAEEFTASNVTATLSNAERNALEEPLSYDELTRAIHNMKKGKSPGTNGYTSAFFKHFWKKLGPFLFRAHTFCYRRDRMIASHKEGIITMIPKAGRSPEQIKAWRPITLLNTDFKIISSAIAVRLQGVIGKLIDPCQTAYVKGRFIGENTRLVYDIIHTLLERNSTGVIISADFESAFDSLSWDFVSMVLKCCNFGTKFRKMLRVIYMNEDNFSRIILNGFLGRKIFLKCGIRQGDPVSGYLFNLAANVLAGQIKRSRRLKGIHVNQHDEVRISQYADDTVLFLSSEASSIRGALSELDTYSKVSGLKLNVEKTACLPIGVKKEQYEVENFGCKWVTQMKILGITFTNNNKDITEQNLCPKIVQIKQEIAQWNRRRLTPLGKITVIKSLLLSKLIHILTVLPNPTQKTLKQLERVLFSFLWGGARDPIKRAKVVQSYASGGLNMVDIQAFVRSLKLTWLKRVIKSKATWAKLATNDLPHIENIVQHGSEKLLKTRSKISNPFWKDVLEAYSRFSIDYTPDTAEILCESLWCSDLSKYKCSTVKDWDVKGLRFIADLVDENNGQLMTRAALQDRFGIRMTILCYTSLVKSLPDCVKHGTVLVIPRPIIPTRMNLILNQVKFSRFAYSEMIKSRQAEVAKANDRQKQKWIRDLGYYEDIALPVVNATRSTQLIMFHYKIVNRILTTNKFLLIIGVRDDDECTFCKQEAETLSHLFWYCSEVQNFLSRAKHFLTAKYNVVLDLNPRAFIFGFNLNGIETLIVTLMKLVIYEARLSQEVPNVAHFKNKLKREAETELTAARMCNKKEIFEIKWGALKKYVPLRMPD